MASSWIFCALVSSAGVIVGRFAPGSGTSKVMLNTAKNMAAVRETLPTTQLRMAMGMETCRTHAGKSGQGMTLHLCHRVRRDATKVHPLVSMRVRAFWTTTAVWKGD